MSKMLSVSRSAVVASIGAVVVASAGVAAAPVAADPGSVSAGQLTVPRSALAGWSVSGPDVEGAVVASVRLPGKSWTSQIEFGPTRDARSSRDVARAIAENAPAAPGYAKQKAHLVGLQITPTTVSGIPATRVIGEVRIDGGPVRGDRLRVTVVDTKPQSYFVSAVPFEAADRIAQADAAERGLTANR